MNKNKDSLEKLNKKELIQVIESYKEKIENMEEYSRALSLENTYQSF